MQNRTHQIITCTSFNNYKPKRNAVNKWTEIFPDFNEAEDDISSGMLNACLNYVEILTFKRFNIELIIKS